MPPPPPPPICFPFISKQQKRRISIADAASDFSHPHAHLTRHPSSAAYSPTSTLTSDADNLTFRTDSEKYDEVPSFIAGGEKEMKASVKLSRGNTMTGTKKSTTSSKWGYGWGLGKKEKEVEAAMRERTSSNATTTPLPLYRSSPEQISQHSTPIRRDSKSSQATRSTVRIHETLERRDTHKSHTSQRSKDSRMTQNTSSSRSSAPRPRPPLMASDSASTLVGSALERKIQGDVESIPDRSVNTTERLADLRAEMAKANVDY